MSHLQHRHLVTLTLNVDFAGMVSIGQTPLGLRRIAPITGDDFKGERLSGKVQGVMLQPEEHALDMSAKFKCGDRYA